MNKTTLFDKHFDPLRPRYKEYVQIASRRQIELILNRNRTLLNWTWGLPAPEPSFGSLIRQSMDSRVIAFGPKLIQLGQIDTEALENTDVNVAWDDYRQPFPTMIVELPATYSSNKVVSPLHAGETMLAAYDTGAEIEIQAEEVPLTHYPELVLLAYDESQKLLIVDQRMSSGRSQHTALWQRPDQPTIEDSLAVLDGDLPCFGAPGVGHEQAAAFIGTMRAALNVMLLLTHYGCRRIGPADPAKRDRLRKKARRKKTAKAVRDQAMRDGRMIPTVFGFEQQIKLHDRADFADGEGQAVGNRKSPRPHWRRGYWRRQRFGPGRAETKLVFIHSLLVNEARFAGIPANTKVTYIPSVPSLS